MLKRVGITIICSVIIMSQLSLSVHANTHALVDFSNSSIEEIQDYVDEGYLSYEVITRVYLNRIDVYQDQYESIISVNQNAIEEAKRLDKIYQESGRLSPLHGIPILVKDNIDVKGMPTTAGTTGLLKNIANEDADIIKNLRDAGAIFIAKANMDEFAYNAAMSKSMFGLVRNAYDLNTSSYGSSGGTASGVASDLAVVGIGTDTGVSIRVPSAANNLYGLRPTKGALSSEGMIHFDSSRDTAGPMAKYAKDAQLVYEVMSMQKKGDTKPISTVRIGIVQSQMGGAPSFIKKMMREKANDLLGLGVEFVHVPAPHIEYEFNSNNFCYEFNEYIKGTTGPINSLQDLVRSGKHTRHVGAHIGNYCNRDFSDTHSYQDYLKIQKQNSQRVDALYKKYNIDALAYPTISEKLQKLSPDLNNKLNSYVYMIAPGTGNPAINIPVGFHQDLPYGMELVGLKGSDYLLLDVAKHLDEINPSYKLPNISPSLYTPIEQIETLKIYESAVHDELEYVEVQSDIHDFLVHYHTYDNKEEVANDLIERYDLTPQVIEENILIAKKNKQKKIIINIVLIFFGLLFSYMIYVQIIRRRNRRRRLTARQKQQESR